MLVQDGDVAGTAARSADGITTAVPAKTGTAKGVAETASQTSSASPT
jgi:hypothetical protein